MIAGIDGNDSNGRLRHVPSDQPTLYILIPQHGTPPAIDERAMFCVSHGPIPFLRLHLVVGLDAGSPPACILCRDRG